MRWTTLILACGLVSCGQETANSSLRSVEPIVFGAVDLGDAYPSAVTYFNGGGKCTASVIAHSGTIGFAITAAHCIDQGVDGTVVTGVDHDAGITYPVTDVEVHPDYFAKGPRFDVAMLQFDTSGLPDPAVMPPMSPADGTVSIGQTVTLAGYGQTESGGTSLRHFKDIAVQGLSPLLMFYDQTNGGVCFGDSGGPAYAATNGGTRVAGVAHAVGSGNCLSTGSSVRVTEVYSTFVEPYMSGGAYGLASCAQCVEATTTPGDSFDGACWTANEACINSSECQNYLHCLDICVGSGCELDCAQDHSTGATEYQAVVDCVCGTGCSAECVTDPFCTGLSQCGFDGPTALCDDCVDAFCCSEAEACADDPGCADCYPDCPANANNDALAFCAADICHDPCGLEEPVGGAGGTGGAGAGGSPVAGAGGVGGGTGGTTPIDSGNDNVAASDDGCSLGGPANPVDPKAGWILVGVGLMLVRRRKRALENIG